MSGMKPMVDFKVDEICRIIKVCARFGVREFQLGELTLKMGDYIPTVHIPNTPSSAIGKSEAIEKEYVAGEELKVKERELAEMMLQDHLSYEKLMEQGDLENAQDQDRGTEHAL